jgi:exopolyphosphatase / guanosine-5'-triphosphate,3'-diphosphate pyrophosphatase
VQKFIARRKPGVEYGARAFPSAFSPRREFPRRERERLFAALDLGTNNCRLLIVRPQEERFIVVDAFSRIVRLGEGLSSSGNLSQEAMNRTLDALRVCADKLQRREVFLARSVATEACRRANNGTDFVRRVHQETGIVLNIITPEEEAWLAVDGCYTLLPESEEPALIFDIGGGSTELVLVRTQGKRLQVIDWMSVPWGVVSLSEAEPYQHGSADVYLANYDRMRARVRYDFAAFCTRNVQHKVQHLLGTSGTVTTLGSIYLGLDFYDRKKVDGMSIAAHALHEICQDIARIGLHARMAYPCVGHDRADLLAPGCAILDELLSFWPVEQVRIADRGIREGILLNLIHGRGQHG